VESKKDISHFSHYISSSLLTRIQLDYWQIVLGFPFFIHHPRVMGQLFSFTMMSHFFHKNETLFQSNSLRFTVLELWMYIYALKNQWFSDEKTNFQSLKWITFFFSCFHFLSATVKFNQRSIAVVNYIVKCFFFRTFFFSTLGTGTTVTVD
jgi:hypothetical protein